MLRGNGPVFSAGMDVAALARPPASPEKLRSFRRACLEAWNLAEEMPKPTVAQIHGVCLGGALELALACDLRVLAEDAFVGLPETRLGLVPDVGGSSRLPQVVGVGRAKELIMTGARDRRRRRRALRAREPRRRDVAAATDELVGELLACAPIAVGLAKRLIDASARPALSTTLELEVTAQELCVRTRGRARRRAGRGRAARTDFRGADAQAGPFKTARSGARALPLRAANSFALAKYARAAADDDRLLAALDRERDAALADLGQRAVAAVGGGERRAARGRRASRRRSRGRGP